MDQARDAIAANRFDVAAQTIRHHLRTRPDDAGAIALLGTIAERSGSLREAEALFARAVALAPADPGPRLALAALLGRTGRIEPALAELDTVLARAPSQPVALSLRAGLLAQHRRYDAADAAFRTLTRSCPDDASGWLNHGHLLRTLGRIEESAAAYRRAIAVSPRGGIAWWGLANLKTIRFEAADVAAMRQAITDNTDAENRLHLHFALGKALDDLGDPAAAFAHLRDGNALRLAGAPHDIEATSATIRRAEAVFTAPFLATRAGAGAAAPDPVFIVGMPRSGSSLIEQILASHPAVEGTGELHDLNHVAQGMMSGRDDSYLDRIATLPPSRLREIGDRYLAVTRRYRVTDRPFFTDKMPSNWVYTGLIMLVLPNARIIDVRRHPMACGFANYAQHYHRGNNFAYDLKAIGQFHADYVRHMAHFDRVAPGRIHRVHHEALIDDPEDEIWRLLGWLGLPFDAACLRFHDTARAVHTPSAAQVRRPLDRAGLDRWRAYAAWLEPLESALGAVLDEYPAPPPRGQAIFSQAP